MAAVLRRRRRAPGHIDSVIWVFVVIVIVIVLAGALGLTDVAIPRLH